MKRVSIIWVDWKTWKNLEHVLWRMWYGINQERIKKLPSTVNYSLIWSYRESICSWPKDTVLSLCPENSTAKKAEQTLKKMKQRLGRQVLVSAVARDLRTGTGLLGHCCPRLVVSKERRAWENWGYPRDNHGRGRCWVVVSEWNYWRIGGCGQKQNMRFSAFSTGAILSDEKAQVGDYLCISKGKWSRLRSCESRTWRFE